MLTLRRLVLLLTVMPLLAIFLVGMRTVCAAESSGTAATSAAPGGRQPVVTAIGVVKGKGGTQITISGDTELTYEYFVIGGKNLAIDIPGATSSVWPAEQQVDDEFVSRIQVAAQSGEKPGVRVVLALKKPDSFTVLGENGRIVVVFSSPRDSAAPNQPALNRVAEVTAARIAGAFRVAVKTDAKPSYRVLDSGDQKRVTIAIDAARLEPNARKASDYSGLDLPVTRISALPEPKEPNVVLVVIDLRQPLPFRVYTDSYGVNVDFNIDITQRSEPALPLQGVQALVPGSTLSAPSAPSAAPAFEPAAAAVRNYSGRKITLDFLDADITDIFRLIAEVSGVNIIATDDVKGRRSVRMTDVPWNQALDLILKTNIPQLVQVAESDTIIRVTTLQRVNDEQAAIEKSRLEQQQRALAEQRQALEKAEFARKFEAENQKQLLEKIKAERQRSKGWLERTFVVSYGDTKEVAARLEKFFSGCKDGCVFESGERSKTIFVRDFVDNIEQMNAVFSALESPTAAVMVEARIVEVQSDYSEAIGIQWGASYVADAAHGNSTKYAFPNTIGISGTQPGNYLVNLPATNAVGGVGIALGHIANTFALDVKLSALEKMGKTKILSNPKVLVIQNEEANINVGSQLPVPRTDTEGNRTVEWKDVGILLKVTPNVTSDGRVFMKVKIEKSGAGATVQTTEGAMFSIERRGADTKVLVNDGETSVIGGIFQQTDTDSGEGIPGLSRIPLLGWLFKSNTTSNTRTELMIFLTPRIVNTSPYRDAPDSSRGSLPDRPLKPAGAATQRDSGGVFGTVGVLRADLTPAGDVIKAVVQYTNDTALTFASSVTMNCKATSLDGKVIGAANTYVFSKDSGPLVPGFQTERELAFPLEGTGYSQLHCMALEAE